MIKRTIIPGPPGTGKTYRLVNTYLKGEVEKYKTPLKKVGFFTFSKNATNISVGRVTKLFSKIDYDETEIFKEISKIKILNLFLVLVQ